MAVNDVAVTPMPRWRCHKKVWALRISAVVREEGKPTMLVPTDTFYAPFAVTDDYDQKHKPTSDGYFVQYDDGYMSWSPRAAFEERYTLIPAAGDESLSAMLERAEAELRAVDLALGNALALDGAGSRADKVQRAMNALRRASSAGFVV